MPTISQHEPNPLQSFYIPVLALALGSFAIGIGEFVIMGLLPEVSTDLGISIPEAGYAISAYAFGVVVGAPLLALAATRSEERRVGNVWRGRGRRGLGQGAR